MSALRKEVPPKRVYHRIRTVALDGRIVHVKFCPGCGQDKIAEDGPQAEFWILTHYKGRAIFCPRCKKCSGRKRQERKELDPAYAEQQRTYQREWTRRWLEDPENREKKRRAGREYARRRMAADPIRINEEARMSYTLRQERKGKSVRRRKTVIDGTAPRVPLSPFREWLFAYAKSQGLEPIQTAGRLGIPDRRMWGYLKGDQKNVSWDVVDKALTRTRWTVHVRGGLVLTIEDLYPNLRIQEKRRGS